MATQSLGQWRGKAERLTKALAKLREETKGAVVHARHDVETVGGGMLAGAIRGGFEAAGKRYAIPLPGGMEAPPEAAAGAALLLLAFSGQTDASADLHAVGSGILAFGGGHVAREWFLEKAKRNQGNNSNGNGGAVG